jgi:hypothetical protein
MNLDTYIETLYQTAKYNLANHIDMLYIQAKSKVSNESVKEIDEKLIEDYLKKRGYTMNYILNKRVMVKDFTCVYINVNSVEVWHDKAKNNNSVFVNESLLTGLPLTLNYFERI